MYMGCLRNNYISFVCVSSCACVRDIACTERFSNQVRVHVVRILHVCIFVCTRPVLGSLLL